MADLVQARRRLKIAMAALLAVDVAALALLFSPLIGSEQSRRDRLQELWRELQQKTKAVEPLTGLDKKIPEARQSIDDFYRSRFTSQQSDISGDLGKLAQQSGVKIVGIKYTEKHPDDETTSTEIKGIDPASVGLQPVQIEAAFSGNYVQLMRFVNGLERNKLFFIVDSVEFGGLESGNVQLKMKLETYLRTGASQA